MKDVMIDIETSGVQPDRAAMIQLAAVKFDLETGEVDTIFFNECLTIPAWRSWQEDTRSWWLTQKPSTLQSIFDRARDPGTVMNEFVDWAGFGNNVRFWSKPITFDYMFVASYLKDFNLPNPFHYRNAMDCRSYLRGLAYPVDFINEYDLEFDGPQHDALFDTLHQVKWMLHNQRLFGKQVVTA